MKPILLLLPALVLGITGQVLAGLLVYASTRTGACFVAAGPDARYLFPRFSPDGNYLLCLRQDATAAGGALCLVPSANNQTIIPADPQAMQQYRVPYSADTPPLLAWLADSRRVAAVVERIGTARPVRDLWIFNTDGKLIRALFPRVNPQPNIRDFAIAPDGNTVALVLQVDDKARLYVLTNLDTATMKEVVQPDNPQHGPLWIDGMTWSADSTTLIFSAAGIDKQDVENDSYDLWRYTVADGALDNFSDTKNEDERRPVLDANGNTLCYLSGRDNLPLKNLVALDKQHYWLAMLDVLVTPANTFTPRFVCNGIRPQLAPDGQKVFVYQQRPGPEKDDKPVQISYGVIFSTQGREQKALYFGPESAYPDDGFTFSANNLSFAYGKDGAIWTDIIGAPEITDFMSL